MPSSERSPARLMGRAMVESRRFSRPAPPLRRLRPLAVSTAGSGRRKRTAAGMRSGTLVGERRGDSDADGGDVTNCWSRRSSFASTPSGKGDSNVTRQPTRVVVLGAGYAGLLFTVRLAGKIPAGDV